MPAIDLKPRAEKFILTLPPKHKRQVKDSILALLNNPFPQDSKKLQGYEEYIRVDIGEYRIIYKHDVAEDLIVVVLVGRRNDDSIYRLAKRALK